jgi:hypothetical protein
MRRYVRCCVQRCTCVRMPSRCAAMIACVLLVDDSAGGGQEPSPTVSVLHLRPSRAHIFRDQTKNCSTADSNHGLEEKGQRPQAHTHTVAHTHAHTYTRTQVEAGFAAGPTLSHSPCLFRRLWPPPPMRQRVAPTAFLASSERSQSTAAAPGYLAGVPGGAEAPVLPQYDHLGSGARLPVRGTPVQTRR